MGIFKTFILTIGLKVCIKNNYLPYNFLPKILINPNFLLQKKKINLE